MALGLMRPSIFSLRSHYEFFLSYLYYRDHVVELEAASSFRDSFNLPGEIKKYLRIYFEEFDYRMKILTQHRTRKDEDYYGPLSGVTHGGAIGSIPTAQKPEDVQLPSTILVQAPSVFSGVAENLSDIAVGAARSNWLSLPGVVQASLVVRLGENAKDELRFH
jgi:hypothetical protein